MTSRNVLEVQPGIMEKNLETTMWYIGVYVGILEKKKETIIPVQEAAAYCGSRVLDLRLRREPAFCYLREPQW